MRKRINKKVSQIFNVKFIKFTHVMYYVIIENHYENFDKKSVEHIIDQKFCFWWNSDSFE